MGALVDGTASGSCPFARGDHLGNRPHFGHRYLPGPQYGPPPLGHHRRREPFLNDGTAAALFQILLGGVLAGHLALTTGIVKFIFAVLGGAILGAVLGYIASRITRGRAFLY